MVNITFIVASSVILHGEPVIYWRERAWKQAFLRELLHDGAKLFNPHPTMLTGGLTSRIFCFFTSQRDRGSSLVFVRLHNKDTPLCLYNLSQYCHDRAADASQGVVDYR